MKHHLLFYPHEVLLKVSQPIIHFDKNLETLIEDMNTIMNQKKGLGIAAPQVNSNSRCFLVRTEDSILTFINPEITKFSQETSTHEEGCLSIPGVFADVVRPYAITIHATDNRGKEFTMEVEGMLARVIQHEMDHLNGILFFSHLTGGMQRRLLRAYEKRQLRASIE